MKIRGTAAHIAEKYMSLARDALASGDMVTAESYLQHAEHYNRIIMAAQSQMGPQHGGHQGEGPNGGYRQQRWNAEGAETKATTRAASKAAERCAKAAISVRAAIFARAATSAKAAAATTGATAATAGKGTATRTAPTSPSRISATIPPPTSRARSLAPSRHCRG